MDGLLGRFLSFDKMITGTIVKFLYYILLVLVILFDIYFVLNSTKEYKELLLYGQVTVAKTFTKVFLMKFSGWK